MAKQPIPDEKDQLASIKRRLRRIEGQLKGIQRMLDEDACCMDLLIQVSAVRAATSKVGTLILENHIQKCLAKALKEDDNEETLAALLNVMNNFIK